MLRDFRTADVDRDYERYTDRLIEKVFGYDNHAEEAFSDVAIAIKKLKEASHWIDEACSEGIDEVLLNKIASYIDSIDDLTSSLSCDLSYWKRGE